MARRYFGTDGIRGTVGQAPITADFVLRLGHSAGRVLKRHSAQPTVLIGKDTRISGYMIESALEAGFASAGVNVLLCGPLPTPAVAYLTRALRLDLGVVISASHNPFQDNGIKFFSSRGEKLPDAWEEEVEAALAEPAAWMDSSALGKARRLDDAAGRYIEFCKASFASDLSLKGLRLVVDAAHGAAYHVAPEVFHELGATVLRMGCSPDGFNINDGVGATSPQALAQAVLDQSADYGIALDGDADRLQMVDRQGRIFNGDELLFVLALDRVRQGQPVDGVVGTLMTNMAIERGLSDLGIAMVRARVGDRYVLEELQSRSWSLGGEGSGHLLDLQRHTTGDGIVSALAVLQACVRSDQDLSKLLEGVQLFPQTLINVRVPAGYEWEADPELARERTRAQGLLGSEGRVLIRKSGTEPVLRVMVESADGDLGEDLAQRIVSCLPQ